MLWILRCNWCCSSPHGDTRMCPLTGSLRNNMDLRVLFLGLVICCALNHGQFTSADVVDSKLDIDPSRSTDFSKGSKDCTCIDFHCGCCAHLYQKTIHLNDTICANATYLRRDYGFSLTVTFDKYTVFNETLSLRNPPPVCIGAPYLEELADVCVRIYDIQASKAHLHACVEVEAELKHVRVAKYDLGCFNMQGDELETAIRQMENEVL